MLAVVDQQQEPASHQVGDDSLTYVAVPHRPVQRHTQSVGHGQWHLVGGVDRGEADPEGPVGEGIGAPHHSGEGQGGLARTAGANQRQQASAVDKLDQGVELGITADQRTHHRRQVRG